MKARNDCEIACDCVKRANVVLHVRLSKEIFVMLCMSSLFVYSDPCTFRHRVSHVVSF